MSILSCPKRSLGRKAADQLGFQLLTKTTVAATIAEGFVTRQPGRDWPKVGRNRQRKSLPLLREGFGEVTTRAAVSGRRMEF